MTNKNENENTPKRRGRPAAFGDAETIARLWNLPVETVERIGNYAAKRKDQDGYAVVTVNRILNAGLRQLDRPKKAKKTEVSA